MVAVLAAIVEAEARVADTGDIAGPLVVNAPTSFGRLHLAPHLRPFLDAHPAIALRLDLTDAFVDLTAARVDLAIRVTGAPPRSEEHTSELQSLMRISYAVFCLKKKKQTMSKTN